MSFQPTLERSHVPLSRKQLLVRRLIVVGLLVCLGTLYFVYRQTWLWKPQESLFTLLPQDPICYVSAKNLAEAVQTFQRSEFGGHAVQMPILADIQQQQWWQQFVYQKRLWEHSMGGALDLNRIKGYLGQEAILALYKHKDEMSFLLISEMGAKERLEIMALAAVTSLNPPYKRLQANYNKFIINTITGYPRDFSYAFIGKIGLLSLSPSLIKDTIDVYAKKKEGLSNSHPMGQSMRMRYNSAGSTAFVNFPRLISTLGSARKLEASWEKIEFWTCSNRYRKGILRSQHEIKWQSDWKSIPLDSRAINQNLLSALPGRTAFSDINHNLDPSEFWEWVRENLAIQHGQTEIDLSRHLGGEITLALLSSTSESAMAIPSIILAMPITNREDLESDLLQLRQEKIVVNRKQLQFADAQDFQGVNFQQVQLPLGFLFALKGGYAMVNDHWIISTTIDGLKSVIEASTGTSTTLAHLNFPTPSDQPRSRHTLIQPNLLIPELKRLVPITSFIGLASRGVPSLALIQHVIDNILPLETLGLVSAGADFKAGGVNLQVQVVVPGNE